MLFFDKQPPRAEKPWTEGAVDLRLPHQPALHPEGAPAAARATWTTSSPATASADRASAGRPSGSARFGYDELLQRDKLNLDIFWLKDESLDDADSLPPPDVIAAEIVENLEAALQRFRSVAARLGS